MQWKISRFILFYSFVIGFVNLNAQTSSQNQPISKEQALSSIKLWNEAHNDWKFNQLKDVYSDKVLFSGKLLLKEECIYEKSKNISPSRPFLQEMDSAILMTEFGHNRLKCSFVITIKDGVKQEQAQAYLVLEQKDKLVKIVAEGTLAGDLANHFSLSSDIFDQKNSAVKTLKSSSEPGFNLTPVYVGLPLALIVFVIILLFHNKRKSKQQNLVSETALTGTSVNQTYSDFEKFVMSKFEPNLFNLHVWSEEKHPEQVDAAANPKPKLVYQMNYVNNAIWFAVECKYVSELKGGKIELASAEKLIEFNTFSHSKNVKFHMVIGIGGKAWAPQELFIVPLATIDSNVVTYDSILAYRHEPNSAIHFDISKGQLI